MTQTNKQVLETIKRTIEKGWTTGSKARDVGGDPVSFWEEEAVKWCLTGALDLEKLGLDRNEEIVQLLDVPYDNTREKVLGQDVIWFNDAIGQTKENVLKMLDRSIEALP